MNDSPQIFARVQFSTIEDARRIILEALDGFSEPKRRRTASQLVAALRDAGCLAGSIEQHYSATAVASLLGRSPEWAAQRIVAGDFGPCSRDGGGWLVPALGVQRYLDAQCFSGSKTEAKAA